MITRHSVVGVIVFSLLVLVIFGLLSAFLVYLGLFLATFIAQNLSARLRAQLFDQIYLPLIKVGGRPVLRIMQYNPQGV